MADTELNYNLLTMRHLLHPLLCFLAFLLLYGLTSHASAGASDEIAAFSTGVALATKHNLIIDNVWSVQKITEIGKRGRGDHLYSRYFPGTALGSAMLYMLARRAPDVPYLAPNPTYGGVTLAPSQSGARVALRLNAVLGALGMMMLFTMVADLFDGRAALLTTLLIGLTTDWWYESQLFYLEVGAGALLIASLYFAFKGRPWLSSFCLGASFLFRPTNFMAFPVWLYAVWGRPRWSLLSGVWIAAAVAFLAFYNHIRFGSLFDFGYKSASFTTPIWVGLAGLLFSPGHSFLLYSPVLLLSAVGAVLLWRKDRPLALVCIVTVVGNIFLIATWQSWSGGKVWGSRLVVPMLPIAGLLIGAVVSHMFHTGDLRLTAAVATLGLIGLGIQLLAIIQDPALSITQWTKNGYATVEESTWSVTKNWLALELRSLRNWSPCNIAAEALRTLLAPSCRT